MLQQKASERMLTHIRADEEGILLPTMMDCVGMVKQLSWQS